MSENENQPEIQSFEQAKAALELELNGLDAAQAQDADLEHLFAIARECTQLWAVNNPTMAGQEANLVRDLESTRILMKAQFKVGDPTKKAEVITRIKERLSNYLKVLNRSQKD